VEEEFGSLPRAGSASDSRSLALQFCLAVLRDIVYHSTPLKTSEVWRAAWLDGSNHGVRGILYPAL